MMDDIRNLLSSAHGTSDTSSTLDNSNRQPSADGSHSRESGTSRETIYPPKPFVGIAVVCKCREGSVECILQKKGPASFGSHKWSFPGGRLDGINDMEENGATGTKRKLMETCGGGAPLGLPPLIHIIWSQSGKNHHTLYHVFSVDPDADEKWNNWNPAPQTEFKQDIDILVSALIIENKSFSCINGTCWVDLEYLARECYHLEINTPNKHDLHPGLINWVQVYAKQTFSHLNIETSLPDIKPQRIFHSRRRHSSFPYDYHYNQQNSQLQDLYISNIPHGMPHRHEFLSSVPTTQQFYPISFPYINPSVPLQDVSSPAGSRSMSPQPVLFNPVSPAISPTIPNPSISAPTSPGGYPTTSPGSTCSENSETHPSLMLPLALGQPHQIPHFEGRNTDSPSSVTSEPIFPSDRRSEFLETPIPPDERKLTPCQYFLQGNCIYGDSCWFYHPPPSSYFERDILTQPHSPQSYIRQNHPISFIQPTPRYHSNLPFQTVTQIPPFFYHHGQLGAAGGFSPQQAYYFSRFPKYPRRPRTMVAKPFSRPLFELPLPNRFSVTGFSFSKNQLFLIGDTSTVLIYDLAYMSAHTSRFTITFQAEESFSNCKLTCINATRETGVVLLGCDDGTIITWNWIKKESRCGASDKNIGISALTPVTLNSLLAGTYDGDLLFFRYDCETQAHNSVQLISRQTTFAQERIINIHCVATDQAITVGCMGDILIWKIDDLDILFMLKVCTTTSPLVQSLLVDSMLLSTSTPPSNEAIPSQIQHVVDPRHVRSSTIHEEGLITEMSHLTLQNIPASSATCLELWDLSSPPLSLRLRKQLPGEATYVALCKAHTGLLYIALATTQGTIRILDYYSLNTVLSFSLGLPNMKCYGIYSPVTSFIPRHDSQAFNLNILSVWSDGTIKIHNVRL